jgi:colicin import membrane protein
LINNKFETEAENMSANQQRWMGGIILLGGSALLASFLFQSNEQKSAPTQQLAPVGKTLNLNPIHRLGAPTRPADGTSEGTTDGVDSGGADNGVVSNRSGADEASGTEQPVQLTPLAVDVDTERKLLAAQHQMREKNVAEQEARTAEFLARQQQAEANSARRVAAEQAARLEARQARNDARNTTDPAMPDANIAADDPAQAAALSRHQADQEKAERSQLRVQKYEAINDRAKDTLAQAVERTAKAKENRESAQKAQIQADKDRHIQAMKDRQEKLAQEKQEKHDAEEAKHELEVKQQKDKLQQEKEQLHQEKQAKLDAAAAKLSDEKAAKLKILQAEKAERAKLRDDTTAAGDAKKAAIQAEVEKNKKEAAILQAKLDKLNAANHSKSSTAQDAQKAKDTARARALLNDDEPAPVTPSVAPTTLVMVQIAMAESQAKADAMVAQLRAKGYKVRTSTTNKGVRVLVGPEKDAAAASAIKHKIEQDGSLKIKGAWVSNWQPPTS